jgi:RHS repeat-associated protein
MSLLKLLPRILVAASALTLAPTLCHAQGIPWYTIPLPVPNGFVDVVTGNVHLEIPLGSMPQRNGDPIVSKIAYDTTSYNYSFGLWNANGPGWWSAVGSSHAIQNDGAPGSGQTCTSFGLNTYPNGSVTTWSGFWFKDINGTSHSLDPYYYTRQVNCYDNYGHFFGNSMDVTATSGTDQDSIGYTFQISNYNQMIIYAFDGTLLFDNTTDKFSSDNGLPIDPNGNIGSPQGSQPNLSAGLPSGVLCGSSTVTTSSGSSATYTGTCTNQNVSNVINGTTYTGTVSLLTSLALPDGTSYSFSYDTGTTGNHYGNLVGVTLPTGGTISFTYTWGVPATLKAGSVVFGGATWSLSYSVNNGKNVTTVLAPSRYDSVSHTNVNDQAVFTMVNEYPGLYLQTAQYYSGTSTLVKTVAYNPSANLPTTVTTTLNDTGQSSQVSYQYGPCRDCITQKQETDFTGTVVRTTKTTYTSGTFIKPASINVYAGSGTGSPIASTLYTYDEYSANYCKNGVPMLASFTGAYRHDDTNFGTSYTARGNVTTIQRLISGTTYATTHMCYDTLGNVTQTVDANGNPTSYDYSENWADTYCIPSGTITHAFPTIITDALGHRTKKSFFTCTVLSQSVKDENDIQAGRNGTTFTYELLNHPLTINYPDGGQTTYCYSHNSNLPCYTTSLPPFSTESRLMSGSTTLSTKTLLDSYGRVAETQLASDLEGAVSTDTTYDALGHVSTVSNPYRSTSDSTYGITSYEYDALGRTNMVIPPDGTTSANNVATAYAGNCSTVTDQTAKARKSCSDALHRLTGVWEDPGASPHLNYETDYTYDALDNLLTVVQNGSRQRTFTYDSLSRLTSATNPESGILTYTFDNNGNLQTRVAPAPNQTGSATITTTYTYDALNRLTLKTYSDGTTPQAQYTWDANSPGGPIPNVNNIGRLATTDSPNSTGNIYNYDPMGRVANSLQCIDVSCNWNSDFSYTYDLLGNLTSYTNKIVQWTNPPASSITFNQSFDTAGRVTQLTSSWVDAQHPATLITADPSIGYFPHGALRKATLGNGLTLTNVYNNRLQPCLIDVNQSNATLQTCNDNTPSGNILDFWMTYDAGTADNGNVTHWNASSGYQSFARTYGYDQLNRVSTLSQTSGVTTGCSSVFGLSWTYDAWGNRTDQNVTAGTCNAFHQTVNAQNRLLSPFQYDAAGNMTNDGTHTYTYDAENRIIQVDGGATATYVYDPSGRRVQKTTGGTTTSYTYDLAGSVFLETQGSTWETFYLYFAGALHAQYKNGVTSFIHGDRLGSTRMVTAMNQSVTDSLDYLPFGEQIAGSSGSTHKLTGDERDSETTLDHTWFRQYSSALGRWMHPDPAGLAAVAPSNPQSWNRYAYVLNNPLNAADPSGLVCIWDDGSFDAHDDRETGNSASCSAAGGAWTDLDMGGSWSDHANSELAAYADWLNSPDTALVNSDQYSGGGLGSTSVFANFISNFVSGSFWNGQLTNPDSCMAVFQEASAEPLHIIHHAADAAEQVGAAAITTSLGASSFANALQNIAARTNPNLGGQLDPILGPVVIAGANALASAAGRFGIAAEEAVAEHLPTATMAAVDASLANGLYQEARAALKGTCH